MLNLLLGSLYFILPASFANMFPVIFGKLNLPLAKPIYGKLFGSHKTWKGFYLGYLGALFILAIQLYLKQTSIALPFSALLNYSEINLFFYAFLFGVGALTGDLVKSFFKRKIGIKPGRPWIIFDQLDFVIGALIFLAPFYLPPWENILAILIITPLLHLFTNLLGFALRLKKVWW